MSKRQSDVIVQPPFDKRILDIRTPGGDSPGSSESSGVENLGWGSRPTSTPIRRGFMKQNKGIGNQGKIQFNYLYNPSTVEASYASNVSDAGLSMVYPTGPDGGALAVPTTNTADWTIMFDRTYELWGSYNKHGRCLFENNAWGNNPQVVGCWADILQLQWFTGMWTSAGAKTKVGRNGGLITNGVNTYGTNVPTGPMWSVPCWAYFGTNVGTFYGAIQSWGYTITHYNQFMVPMRCVIDIHFTMYPNPATTSGPSNTGATANKHGGTVQYYQPFNAGENPIYKP